MRGAAEKDKRNREGQSDEIDIDESSFVRQGRQKIQHMSKE